MRHNKILDFVSGVHGRPVGNRLLCRFHYADIIAGHPGGEESDWWRALGPLQQSLNSRAIVCHWKIHGKKRKEKGAGKERERDIVESGRHNLAVSENGEKWLGVRFSWKQSRIFFFFFGTRAPLFFREKWGKIERLHQSISLSGTWFCDHYY